MRQFNTEDFFKMLLEEGWLEKFVESGFCWDKHKTKNTLRLSDFLCVTVSWVSESRKEVHERLRILLKERGVKGVKTFHMPEQIKWCGCQPRELHHEKLKSEFYDILYERCCGKLTQPRIV